MSQDKLLKKSRFSLPFFQVGSGAFMIFSILLVGVLFYLLLAFVDIFFIPNNTPHSVINQLQQYEIFTDLKNFTFLHYTAIITSTVTVGFFIYIVSYIFISFPAFLLREHKIFKNQKEKLKIIINHSFKELKEFDLIKNDLKFQDAFLYQFVSNSQTLLAENTRFTFIQLMYARSAIFILLILCLYYILLLHITSIIAWV